MAIPVYLQQFKAAGVYRVVFDKSTILNVDTEILRLVVGYSEQGPFNAPTYIKSVSEFKSIYGGISRKLEKRGIFFHRLAIQALGQGPILCLNLKKFNTETVDGATISTDFNPTFLPIDTVKLNVEDIYDTSRFWELSAEKMNGIRTVDGTNMDSYINICTTDTKEQSATYFIRKASGSKVKGYDITVSDWYEGETIPEYLQKHLNNKIADFFAEVYVFRGKFKADQVLASNTLKNYFEISASDVDEYGDPVLKLKDHVIDAYGEYVDTLDTLYNDPSSNAINHYIGCLIPYFIDKQGTYQALDIIFNTDQSLHRMMMSFNTDLLDEEDIANIDLSGKSKILVEKLGQDADGNTILIPNITGTKGVSLSKIYNGTATTSLLGNIGSRVIADNVTFTSSAIDTYIPFEEKATKVNGTLYVREYSESNDENAAGTIVLKQVATDDVVTITYEGAAEKWSILTKLGAAHTITSTEAEDNGCDYHDTEKGLYYTAYISGVASYFDADDAFEDGSLVGPDVIITSISKVEKTDTEHVYTDVNGDMKVSKSDTYINTTNILNPGSAGSVYDASVTFIPVTENWTSSDSLSNTEFSANDIKLIKAIGGGSPTYISTTEQSLLNICHPGDCFLAADGTADMDGDGIYPEGAHRDGDSDGNEDNDLDDAPNGYYDTAYVQKTGSMTLDDGRMLYYVIFTAEPIDSFFSGEGSNKIESTFVRIDSALNQEIGTMTPQYLQGYVYQNSKPSNTSMKAKLDWQLSILSTLTEYKGLRTGLLNKSDIDYRYIVDTFESFPETECKNTLSYLAKEKQSAFAILNFPSVKTFRKCPYTSFVDDKGVFNVQYVVDGYNKRKASSVAFSLPTDTNGASFCAFYTPLKFSDGYIDTIVPSAGLVSNLFMGKYMTRQPYYIIAGPNYGNISSSGLIGPDYKYSNEELNIIEPFGVNCMVYRPNFGTFINANQTAKQSPKSALSAVNVRELVIYLQDEIEKVLQEYQWEFNNATTRAAIKGRADMICSKIQNNGGIQDFLNVMDESNNTSEIIDNEMAILDTHIEPGRGMGKMVQQLTLYSTGKMRSTISE